MKPTQLVKELNDQQKGQLSHTIAGMSKTAQYGGIENIIDAVKNAFPDRTDISDEDIQDAVTMMFDRLFDKQANPEKYDYEQ